jgi:predicted dienelactone hydrolase
VQKNLDRRVAPTMGLAALLTAGCTGGDPTPDAAATIDAAPAPDAQLDPPTGDPLDWAVDALGPFGVGYRSFPLSYVPRGQTEAREISVHVWYPTLAASGRHPTYELLFRDDVAIVDAPPAEPAHAGGYPLFVHSHGWRGFPGASWPMLGALASHGWVVVMPEHVGSTLRDFEEPRPIAHYYERSLDVTEAVDALAALPASDPLSRTVTERFVLAGHSFGVHTVWASVGATFDVDRIRASCMPAGTCTDAELAVFAEGVGDPRIVAAMPIAGDLDEDFFGTTGHARVTVPLLSLTGSADGVDGAAQQAQVAPPVHLDWVEVEGACHNSFAVPTIECATIDSELASRVTWTHALAFARVHLLGDDDPVANGIVDGSRPVERSTFHATP